MKLNPQSTEHIMKAECYIFLINFINAPTESMQNGTVIKKVDVESDLWLEGINVGKLASSFVIEHLSFFRQKIAGVMTETGHKKSAPVIMGKSSNPKIKELIKLFDETKNLYYLHESVSEDKKSALNINIREKLEDLNNILNETDKISIKSFIYRTMEDMIKFQELLIEMGEFLLQSLEKLDYLNEKITYTCMTSLYKRGEFDLSALGFEQDLNKKQIDMKKKVGVDYQNLVYNQLGEVFTDLEQKGLNDYRRNFIEFFLAYAYFRIPEFRNELLSVLSGQKINESVIGKQNKEIESVLLDWDKDFIAHLQSEEKYAANKEILNQVLRKNWREKFQKKGIIFFYFLIQWCEYVVKTLVVKNFFWENIYGYEVLINAFVEQLGNRNINKYPDVLIQASKSILANPNILDIMVKTLIAKTK